MCPYRYLLGVCCVLLLSICFQIMYCCIPTPTTDSDTSTGVIWVELDMPSAAEECRKHQGIVREFHIVWKVVTLIVVCCWALITCTWLTPLIVMHSCWWRTDMWWLLGRKSAAAAAAAAAAATATADSVYAAASSGTQTTDAGMVISNIVSLAPVQKSECVEIV